MEILYKYMKLLWGLEEGLEERVQNIFRDFGELLNYLFGTFWKQSLYAVFLDVILNAEVEKSFVNGRVDYSSFVELQNEHPVILLAAVTHHLLLVQARSYLYHKFAFAIG